MTRIDRAISECGKMLLQTCPGDYIRGEPVLDEATAISNGNLIIGCRGKTCKECWDEEVDHE